MPATTHELVIIPSSSPPGIPDSDIISTPPHLRASPSPSPSLPPQQQHQTPQPPSPLSSRSSSSLPSPARLLKRPALHGLRSGSRAAHIPEGVALGFASAGTLVREHVLSLDDVSVDGEDTGTKNDRITHGRPAGGATARRKPRPKKAGEDEAKPASKKKKVGGKKSRSDVQNDVVDGVETRVVSEGTDSRNKSELNAVPPRKEGTEKPRMRGAEAIPNNSRLLANLKDLPGSIVEPQPSPRRGGAVEKLKRKKAKDVPARVDSGISTGTNHHGSTLDEPVPEGSGDSTTDPPKLLNHKPTAQLVDQASVEPAQSTQSITGPHLLDGQQNIACEVAKNASRQPSPKSLAAGPASVSRPLAPANDSAEPLNLSPAPIRRRSWTPLEDTKSSPNAHDQAGPIDSSGSPSSHHDISSFSRLLNAFSYDGQKSNSAEVSGALLESGRGSMEQTTESIERPIESPATNTAHVSRSHSERTKKPEKAPKKKPRTITDLAMAAYRPAAAVESHAPHDTPGDSSASLFFPLQVGSVSDIERPSNVPAEKPKSNGRSKRATRKAESKAKKPAAKSTKVAKKVAEKLLSPRSALLRMNGQDILFGTSSQLAREESPTFVRNLQQAIHDSELLCSQKDHQETLHLRPSVSGSGLSLVGRRTGLWAAASRDQENGTFERGASPAAQVVKTNLPVDEGIESVPAGRKRSPSHTQAQSSAAVPDTNEQATQQIESAISGFFSNDDVPEAPSAGADRNDDFDKSPSAQHVDEPSDYIDIEEFDHANGLTELSQPSISSMPKQISQLWSPPRRTSSQQLETRPSFLSPSRSKPCLSAKASSATFATKAARRDKKADHAEDEPPAKRPVGRPRKSTAADVASRAASVAQPGSPPKRASGRPRKAVAVETSMSPAPTPKRKARSTPTATPSASPKRKRTKVKPTTDGEWPNVDDIEDSHEEISPSPPRRTKGATTHPELTLTSSQAESNLSGAFGGPTVLAPGDVKRKRTDLVPHFHLEAVFPMITAALKACPPSTNVTEPSWHEKILLYDPIIVEDLTEWLAGQGVQIGVIEPVAEPKTKRKKTLAEAEGTLASGSTGRKKLQNLPAWVVQKWCEENSICCMTRELQWTKGRSQRKRNANG